MVISDTVLEGIAIASLSMWSIRTQCRNAGCEHPRVRRLLQVEARVAGPDKPEVHSIAVAGREDIDMSIDDAHSLAFAAQLLEGRLASSTTKSCQVEVFS